GDLPEAHPRSIGRNALALVADTSYFALWSKVAPTAWMPALVAGYLLATVVILHDLGRTVTVVIVTVFIALVLPFPTAPELVWTVLTAGGVAIAVSVYEEFINHRMSNTLRHNVIIRSQAEGAREAERQRIAADFHDGPLQSF